MPLGLDFGHGLLAGFSVFALSSFSAFLNFPKILISQAFLWSTYLCARHYSGCCDELPRPLFRNEGLAALAAKNADGKVLSGQPLWGKLPQLQKTSSPNFTPPSCSSQHPKTDQLSRIRLDAVP